MMARERDFGPDAVLAAGEAAEQRGDYLEATAAYTRIAEDADAGVAAEGFFRLGRVAWRQGKFDRALDAYGQARTRAEQAGRDDLAARVENGIGAVHYARGEYAQARASYQVAMERTRDPVLIGRFLLNLGVIANIEGDLENALWHYLRARALFRDNGDRTSEALALHNLGMIHADREEWDSAADAYGQCLVLCEQQGNRQMIANVLLNESEVLVARRDFTAAVRNCELAMSIYTDIGDEVGRGEAHRWRGYAQRVAGDLEAAERSLNEAVLAGQRLRARLLEAEACREMAALRRGHADAARWRERAVALFRDLGARRELDAMEREAGES